MNFLFYKRKNDIYHYFYLFKIFKLPSISIFSFLIFIGFSFFYQNVGLEVHF